MNTAPPFLRGRLAALMLTGIIGLAFVGYLVGISGGRLRHKDGAVLPLALAPVTQETSPSTLPATSYSEMRRRETGPTSQWEPHLEPITAEFNFQRCLLCHDPHTAVIRPNEGAKLRSLELRASRRGYNGAPPIIPHSVEQTDDAACYSCHGAGARVGDRTANQMSHGFLANCLQCHAVPPPKIFASYVRKPTNRFVGSLAPISAPRAFAGSPPEIPHSTWMRETCLSCHGGDVGWPGLEVTHRWRANCLQCHPATAPLDVPQIATVPSKSMLSSPQP